MSPRMIMNAPACRKLHGIVMSPIFKLIHRRDFLRVQDDKHAFPIIRLAGERPATDKLRGCLVGEGHRVPGVLERPREGAQLLSAANKFHSRDPSETLSPGNGDEVKLRFQLLLFVLEQWPEFYIAASGEFLF